MKYSFIIPIYNRPDELDELLESITLQTITDFEVVVVEDGSTVPCRDICDKYADRLDIHYFAKPNSGPGPSRNYGVERAQGDYVIILDSDVVLPKEYLQNVNNYLNTSFGVCASHAQKKSPVAQSSSSSSSRSSASLLGGPDRAGENFTMVQKAISYSMTSFFTTGGIRGGKKKLDKFFPRSFNMIVLRQVFNEVGGFAPMRFGEDIDFSYRVCEAGYKTALIPDAWVWHKRRTDFDKFYRQVFNSGRARIELTRRHPGTLKLVHLLPTAFTVGVISLIALSLLFRFIDSSLWLWCLVPIVLYSLLIFIDSSRGNNSMQIGILSVEAAFIQLFGYGFGFISALFKTSKPNTQNSTPNTQNSTPNTQNPTFDEGIEFNKKFYGQ